MADSGRTVFGSASSGLAPSMVARYWEGPFSGAPSPQGTIDPMPAFDWDLSTFEDGSYDGDYQQHQLLTLGRGIYCVSLSLSVPTPTAPDPDGTFCYSSIAPWDAGDFAHVQRSISAFQGGGSAETGASLTFGAEDGYTYRLQCTSNPGGLLTGARVALTIVKFA